MNSSNVNIEQLPLEILHHIGVYLSMEDLRRAQDATVALKRAFSDAYLVFKQYQKLEPEDCHARSPDTLYRAIRGREQNPNVYRLLLTDSNCVDWENDPMQKAVIIEAKTNALQSPEITGLAKELVQGTMECTRFISCGKNYYNTSGVKPLLLKWCHFPCLHRALATNFIVTAFDWQEISAERFMTICKEFELLLPTKTMQEVFGREIAHRIVVDRIRLDRHVEPCKLAFIMSRAYDYMDSTTLRFTWACAVWKFHVAPRLFVDLLKLDNEPPYELVAQKLIQRLGLEELQHFLANAISQLDDTAKLMEILKRIPSRPGCKDAIAAYAKRLQKTLKSNSKDKSTL